MWQNLQLKSIPLLITVHINLKKHDIFFLIFFLYIFFWTL